MGTIAVVSRSKPRASSSCRAAWTARAPEKKGGRPRASEVNRARGLGHNVVSGSLWLAFSSCSSPLAEIQKKIDTILVLVSEIGGTKPIPAAPIVLYCRYSIVVPRSLLRRRDAVAAGEEQIC